ncbi:MAG TPA: hypothetical protein VH138_07665 [Vicinamibacterales bacterium]|nr:hypothetical protein [Vicinamibacterales bacterium]
MARVKTWVWVVIGVVAVGILCVIALAAAGIWFVRTHINVQPTTVAAATSDFQTVRDRFATQTPLIELDDHGNFVHANTDRPNGTTRPEALAIMAFDSRDERVVRMDIPFWLLRLKMRGTRINVGGNGNIDLAKLRLTVEDLERFGPTLIVDHRDADGSRVLVWTE